MNRRSCWYSLGWIGRAIFIGLISGALLGIAIYLYPDKPPEEWSQISSPPDRPIELLGYYYIGKTVYIKTARGDIYACASDTRRAKEKECEKLTQLPDLTFAEECGLGFFPTPKPPGIVMGKLCVCPRVPDSRMQVNHIILKDGSLWKWEWMTSEFIDDLKILFIGVLSIIGVFLGLIGGIISSFLRHKRQSQMV